MIIGELSYTISGADGQLIDIGRKVVMAGDIESTLVEGEDFDLVKKSLRLGREFTLMLAGGTSGTTVGFGLCADHIGERCFCWEWFNVRSPGYAVKLQETGLVRFEPVDDSIGRMEFVEPVSIRVHRFPDTEIYEHPDWRVEIDAGSWIDWMG